MICAAQLVRREPSMDEISEAELLAAARAGVPFDGDDAGERRPVRAGLLRRCCRELAEQIDPRGLQLRNTAITGGLDLAGLAIPFPLRLVGCHFDAPLSIEGAQLYELVLTRCAELPGLLANGVRIRRDLDLSGARVTGALRTSASTRKHAAIWLCESEIGGRLLCVDTVIEAGGERSIQADRLHVHGNVRLIHDFAAQGEIRLIGAHIDGSIDLTGASIESPVTGLALDLAEAAIDGSVFLIDDATRQPHVHGRIDMGRARIGGQFLVRNARLEAHSAMPVGSAYSRSRLGRTALSAPRLSVGAEVTLEGACRVSGGIDLSMSELSRLSIGTGCSLDAPGAPAVDLTNAELLSTFRLGRAVTVAGTTSLRGAKIHGNVCLRGAVLHSPQGHSLLAAQGVKVDGEAELQKLTATGGDIDFGTAAIGSVIDASGARLANPGGYTLSLNQANVRGSVRLTDGFESEGVVALDRATVEGRLQCSQGSFHCPAPSGPNLPGHAIQAVSATIRGGMDLGWKSVSPSVNFTNASTQFLADDPGSWPASYIISGFTYERFGRPQGSSSARAWDLAARRAWLLGQASYDAGPYEQAAQVFRQHGYNRRAEEMQIAQRRDARHAITGRGAALRRAANVGLGLTVGYGYRPGWVFWLLVALLVLVAGSLAVPALQATMRATTSSGVIYGTHGPLPAGGTSNPAGQPPDACGGGAVRCFNAVFYAIDTVIPLVTLEQRSTWYPDPSVRHGTIMEWWLYVATLLGWLLSSIFVLALARLARST
jgi:hypothetical protein